MPYTALPPSSPTTAAADGPVPLVVTWHMMDAPCTDAAFAAALPLHGLPAWRVHLGMPLTGRRASAGGMADVVARSRHDAVRAYLEPLVRQAADEFPAALAALREQLTLPEGPLGIVGGSLGGAVALRVLARGQQPVAAAVLVNPAVRGRTVVGVVEEASGQTYPWDEETRRIAGRLDFVARATDIAARTPQPPLLVLSGELDYPALRADAQELTARLRELYDAPDHVRLTTVPGLGHPLAERPGLEPAPQLPLAKDVDAAATEWFLRHCRGRRG